jgi:hypothetical protein
MIQPGVSGVQEFRSSGVQKRETGAQNYKTLYLNVIISHPI